MPRKVMKTRVVLQAELDEANELIEELQDKLDDIAGIAGADKESYDEEVDD